MTVHVDVAIVGAGASGLAAARVLREGGVRALVLEARADIGGRIRSVHAPALDLPVELGAELIHGEAPRTLALAREMKLPIVTVPDAHYVVHRKRLTRIDDYFDELGSALGALAPRGADRSVTARAQTLRSPRRRRMVLDYVRGFEAADPDLASAAAMAASAPRGHAEQQQLRLVNGYGPLIRGLARDLDVRRCRIVEQIAWQRGRVEIRVHHDAHHERYVAKAVIVTVPIGVLQAPAGALGRIDFHHSVPSRALAGLSMGHVSRIVLHANGTIGQLLGHDDASFVHAFGAPFPAWWSPVPMRTPIIVGWVGGPPAIARGVDARRAITTQALATLRALGAKDVRIHDAWIHDWRHDPFARGAYAFPLVGGAHAGARLARPVDGTLFFAGEATSESYAGTVEGAIETGERAARSVLRIVG